MPAGGIVMTPDQIAAILAAGRQQAAAAPMPVPPQWSTDAFGPGRPLPPAPINQVRPDTGRAEPRLWEYPQATNLQIDSRIHVPWRILQEAADIFLIRECIESRKAVCQLDYAVIVDPGAVAREAAATGGAKKDIESALRDQYKAQISAATDWLACPDRQNNLTWPKWTSLLMENSLVFDAGVVYPRYSYGGDCIAWRIIDGKTIKPLLDEDGAIPMPPWPAYQQILYGFPRSEFTATPDVDASGKIIYGQDGRPKVSGFPSDTLMYERRVLRSKTPYGMSDVEIALLSVMLWMRRFGWMMGEYDQASMPATLVETDNAIAWDVTQWEVWLHALNDQLAGSTAERLKLRLMPPGTHVVQAAGIPEQYRPDYDLFLVKLVCGALKTPASEIGFTETGALGASFHEGDEDILYRRARIPDAQWLSGIATRLAQRHIGMPSALKVTILGLESEDEAAADAVALQQVQSGRITLNEDRARLGLTPYDFDEADMPQLMTPRGIVFIEGASSKAPPGTLIGPEMLPPGGGAPVAGTVSANGREVPIDQGGDDDEDGAQGGKPAAAPTAKAEAAAYRSWARKPGRGRQFECVTLTKATAPPDMAADPRVLFKAGDGDPKALAGRGLAGTGTRR